MSSDHKNTVLLLGHNQWQERALVLTLKLGGYSTRIVEDVNEAINFVKALPETVHSIILPGTGCQATLKERLVSWEANRLSTPVYLIGLSAAEMQNKNIFMDCNGGFKLSCCLHDQLLECLEQ